jgi:LPXTG-motif cell wall-anchored protein
MAAAAVVLLLVLSMGVTKAGAVGTVTYPPCTTNECTSNGDTFVLVLHAYVPGSVVTLHVYVDTNGDGIVEDITLTGVADANGDVIFEWDIPAGFAGDVNYTSEGIDEATGEVRTESGSVFVEDTTLNPDNGGGGGGPLPYTGSDSTNLVRIGLVLIVAGGISVVAVRRRNAGTNA